ncbi:tetratricopeptide repeat protein [Pseudacidobacterium ailaaui]|jgi:hypothetical protein|uniref:tetratricopeptide repeat protein n=1 Tax=Pseudacidobacterium ailaaui TaxID=1382359 RepID=UPI0006795DC8|nr:hypothetical protein [Pseudacidobacterium ailaaui]MDI3255778.1 hypothetical protein [Bacillota bacterium]
MGNKIQLCAFFLLFTTVAAFSQKNTPPPDAAKATCVYPAKLYVEADESAARVATIQPGREMVVAERSGKWLRVFANTDVSIVHEQDVPVFGNEGNTPPVSGWLIDKGIVTAQTPHGDEILFGAAATMELQASEPHPPPGAALSARGLYRMVAELFPQSPRTPEAMWRAADIRWQLQKADAFSLPSAHEKEAYLREQIDESEMKKIIKLYPRSRWAALAAYDMIDNKICGDWQGSAKCPEKEAELFVKYADEYPDSPRAAQALYQAAWREASAGDMYQADQDDKKAEEARAKARDLSARLQSKYAQSDYAARAAGLVFMMEQKIPIYGSQEQ